MDNLEIVSEIEKLKREIGRLRNIQYPATPAPHAGGRLTLTSATPVTTADVTGAGTIYYTPYAHDWLGLYSGNQFIPHQFIEHSVAVPATIYRLFDIFDYSNAGTPTLETLNWNQTTGAISGATNAAPIVLTVALGHGLVVGDVIGVVGVTGNTAANGIWYISVSAATTVTLHGSTGNGAYAGGGTWYKLTGLTRATALARQNGILVKTGDATRRYLGTSMTWSTSGQTHDSKAARLLWNAYNRVRRQSYKVDGTGHAYATATYRYWNNDPQWKLYILQGYPTEPYLAQVNSTLYGGAIVGVGNNNSSVALVLVYNSSAGGESYGASQHLDISGSATTPFRMVPMLEYGGATAQFAAVWATLDSWM